ncbi:MAG: UDP-N-acetylmuramate--L-alanine ligase [Acidimicrobiales bacterium]|jgi:UDP-N-acetylmuramate--alanine ligase
MSEFGPGVNIHIVGVGGAGMSGLALLLSEMGCVVSGSDVTASPVLDSLKAAGVQVDVGHDGSHGSGAQVVLWSPAVREDNVELIAARERGATLLSRAQVLKRLSSMQPVIGLTGTHGKTTATSMMVHVLRAGGRDDSRLLGAPVNSVGANGHWGSGSLVLEVDESYGTFALLAPFALGLLNVEVDHLDHYGTLQNLEEAFARLLVRTTGPVVAWGDDEGARRVSDASGREVILVGAAPQFVWRVDDVSLSRRGCTFTLVGPHERLDLALRVTGLHNVANAAVVAVLARSLGVDGPAVIDGLAAFEGAPRRFQFLGRWRGVDVYEDYAHLPGEIAATLAATKSIGYERITAVFQPHRVTRTINLAPQFAAAFGDATTVVVTDIYRAGEDNPTGVTGEIIANHIRLSGPDASCAYGATFSDVVEILEVAHDRSDVILLLGAGDIADVAGQLSGGLQS